jgi:hypothetical protein
MISESHQFFALEVAFEGDRLRIEVLADQFSTVVEDHREKRFLV